MLVTSNSFAAKNGALLRNLITALMRGMKRSLVDPAATAKAMGPWTAGTGVSVKSNVAQYQALRQFSFFGTNQNPHTAQYAIQSTKAYDDASDWLHALGLIPQKMPAAGWVTNQFITPKAMNPRL